MRWKYYIMGIEPWQQYSRNNDINDVIITPMGIDQGTIIAFNRDIDCPTLLLQQLIEHDTFAEISLDEYLSILSRISKANLKSQFQAKWN